MKCEGSPFISRQLELCNDVESNPGPLRPGTNKSTSSSSSNGSTSYASLRRVKQQQKQQQQQQQQRQRQQQQHKAASMVDLSHGGEELELGIGPTRVDRLEREMQGLQQLLSSLDTTMLELKESVDGMRPAYNQALQMLSAANYTQTAQKNNLVFHGIEPDALEYQMESEPEFCRDVLETRIKMIFREHLRIARDMPFTQVYRVEAPMHANADAPRPLVVGFKSLKDKDNILRHTNLLRREGIYITEDTTGKVPPWMKASPSSPFKKKKAESISSNGSAGNRNSTPTQQSVGATKKKADSLLEQSDHMSSCNSDYAPSSHSGNSSSGAFTDD